MALISYASGKGFPYSVADWGGMTVNMMARSEDAFKRGDVAAMRGGSGVKV